MAGKWYESRINQAAMIGGVFLVLATIAGTLLGRRHESRIPPLEIKTLTDGSPQVLARLALDPRQFVTDSATFGDLSASVLVVNDSLGIAIERPTDYRWRAGALEKPGRVDLDVIPFFKEAGEGVLRALQIDTISPLQYYGVQQDHPVKLTLNRNSRVLGIPVGKNPAQDQDFVSSMLRLSGFDDLSDAELAEARREWRAQIDSLLDAELPKEISVYPGVYITAITQSRFEGLDFYPWVDIGFFDKIVVAMVANYLSPPTFLYVDRDAGIIAFNKSVIINNASLNGTPTDDVIVNEVGYAVQSGEMIFTVFLQHVSSQDEKVLSELERFLRSVRLRTHP